MSSEAVINILPHLRHNIPVWYIACDTCKQRRLNDRTSIQYIATASILHRGRRGGIADILYGIGTVDDCISDWLDSGNRCAVCDCFCNLESKCAAIDKGAFFFRLFRSFFSCLCTTCRIGGNRLHNRRRRCCSRRHGFHAHRSRLWCSIKLRIPHIASCCMIVPVRLLFSLCLCNLGILGGEGIGRSSCGHGSRWTRLLLRVSFTFAAAAKQCVARYRCSGKNSHCSYAYHDELFLHGFGAFCRVCIIIRNVAGGVAIFFYKILFIGIRVSMKEFLLDLLNIEPHHLCFTALFSFAESSFWGNISTYSRSEYLSRAWSNTRSAMIYP